MICSQSDTSLLYTANLRYNCHVAKTKWGGDWGWQMQTSTYFTAVAAWASNAPLCEIPPPPSWRPNFVCTMSKARIPVKWRPSSFSLMMIWSNTRFMILGQFWASHSLCNMCTSREMLRHDVSLLILWQRMVPRGGLIPIINVSDYKSFLIWPHPPCPPQKCCPVHPHILHMPETSTTVHISSNNKLGALRWDFSMEMLDGRSLTSRCQVDARQGILLGVNNINYMCNVWNWHLFFLT